MRIKFDEKMLVAQDLSAIGNLSLAVAIPILQVQKIQLAILPTSLLSTQSEGFGTPAVSDCYSFVKATFAHWQTQNVNITAALVGYIDNLATGKALYQYLNQAKLELVVIDPVFADEGKFYPNFDERHLALQKKLLQVADFATPNLTEAKFLTGQMQNTPDLTQLAREVERLLRPGGRAVITGVELDGQKGCIWLEEGQLKTCVLPKVKGHFYGSGDVFAALLASFLRQGVSFEQAIKQATSLTQQALIQTADQNVERSYGIYLGELLPQLAKGISHED